MSTATTAPTPPAMMNRQLSNLLSDEIMDALAPVARKHGLTLDRKSGKFNDVSFTLPVILKIEALAKQNDKKDFEFYAHSMGCDPEWFGQCFEDNSGKIQTVVGINQWAPKNCVKLESEDGKRYRCSPAYIRQYL